MTNVFAKELPKLAPKKVSKKVEAPTKEMPGVEALVYRALHGA